MNKGIQNPFIVYFREKKKKKRKKENLGWKKINILLIQKYFKFTKPLMPNDGTYSLFHSKGPRGIIILRGFFHNLAVNLKTIYR